MHESQIKVKAMAIVEHDGRILATKGFDEMKKEAFFRLPGGHVEFGETAEVALRREFMEELGSSLKNVRFIEAIENLFTYNGIEGHEIVFLYKADLERAEIYSMESFKFTDGKEQEAVWIKTEDVLSGSAILYPDCKLYLPS